MSIKLKDIFPREAIQGNLSSLHKSELIRELVLVLKRGFSDLDTEKVVQILLDREHLGSTAIGEGIAIPHGKLEGIDRVIGAFGRSKQGVNFDAYDQKNTHLFFLLLAPEGKTGIGDHLKALAKISRLLRSPDFRDELFSIEDEDTLYQYLIHADR